MGCCGGGKTRTVQQQPRSVEMRSAGAPVAGSNGSDKIVRYVGMSAGKKHWRAPSGKAYAFGQGDPLQLVLAGDVSWFAGLPEFQVVEA